MGGEGEGQGRPEGECGGWALATLSGYTGKFPDSTACHRIVCPGTLVANHAFPGGLDGLRTFRQGTCRREIQTC